MSDSKLVLSDERIETVNLHMPLVTVILANYNYEKYIGQCLESVFVQQYQNFECFIVDDKSTDNSVAVIQKFLENKNDPRFTLLTHEENSGQLAAFKTGLEKAKGLFTVFVDTDDVLLEDFLSAHLKVHLTRASVAFTSSNQYQINESGELISGDHPSLKANNEYKVIEPAAIHEHFWVWATTSSMMFRTVVLKAIMPKSCDSFRVCADVYICQFANIFGGSILMPTVHGCYRKHSDNNFSRDVVIGVWEPVGKASKAPQHHTVRQEIMQHLMDNHRYFHDLIGPNLYFFTLTLVATPKDIIRLRRKFPQSFSGLSFLFIAKFVVSISIMRRFSNVSRKIATLKKLFLTGNWMK